MRQLPITVMVVLCGLLLVGCGKTPVTPPEPLSDDVLGSRARAFVGFMADGKHQDAVKMMDSAVAAALPADRLMNTWDTLLSQVGAFDEITGVRFATESGYRIAYVTSQFETATLDTKIVFDSEGRVSGLWFGPSQTPTADYKQPSYALVDSFTEIEVELKNGEWVLPATLTMPKGEGPFAAVVLVHGSGPNDCDETIGPNKPFKDLAMGLASKGVAVLRYEKRTKQYQQELMAHMDDFTVNEETVDDALAAVSFLRKTERVDADSVFVIGHSLGASLAPRIVLSATQRNDQAPGGIVMMAPSARPLLDLMLEQYEYLANLDGQVLESEEAAIGEVRAGIAKIKGGTMESGEIVLGAAKAYWDDLLAYDPVLTAKSLDLPMLILQGERDYQVTMEDFALWSEGLAGKSGVSLKSLPGLNHLFIFGEGKSSPEEYNVPGNVDAVVIDTIVEWVEDCGT